MGKQLTMPAATLALIWATGAQAAPITFSASLSGAAENPSNDSPGTGFATVVYDDEAHTLAVEAEFSGLTTATRAAHIHCCVEAPGNAGVATQVPSFAGFPLGVTAGTFSRVFDLTDAASFNPDFIVASGGSVEAAEAMLADGLSAGEAYFNVHTVQFPGGEIRGFLNRVPEPDTAALLGLTVGMLILGRTRH